jgi:hypothetical protein
VHPAIITSPKDFVPQHLSTIKSGSKIDAKKAPNEKTDSVIDTLDT